jgi:hypothetical protein
MSRRGKDPPVVMAHLLDDMKTATSATGHSADLKGGKSAASQLLAKSSEVRREDAGCAAGGTKANFEPRKPNVAAAKKFLTAKGWPAGLQEALLKSVKKLPLRYFICDDSGSMLTNDGHRILGSGPSTKIIGCTRWSELVDSLRFHAELSVAAGAPSEFRLINVAKPIMLGMGEGDEESLEELNELFENGPAGQTPICDHIRAVIADIRSMEDKLKANKQRVAVIIATDGEATDGDIAEAMKPMQDLPVWVVIRICTDEDKIVSYWNDIDEELELEIDVLDDFSAEGVEVTTVNGWLTYGEPMHKLREFGAVIKECDLLDESTLSTEQMHVIVSILLAKGDTRAMPHPEADWEGFLAKVKEANDRDPPVFDPLTLSLKPWIKIPEMCSVYKRKDTTKSAACTIS